MILLLMDFRGAVVSDDDDDGVVKPLTDDRRAWSEAARRSRRIMVT